MRTYRECRRAGAKAAWDRLPNEPPRAYTKDERHWWREGWRRGHREVIAEETPDEPDSSRPVEWRNTR